MTIFRRGVFLNISLAVLFSLIFVCQGLFAQVFDLVDTKEEKHVFLYKGDLISLKVYSLTRIAIVTPGIIKIQKADVDQILLIGEKEGVTPMYIWDEFGKRRLTVRVLREDLEEIMIKIKRLLEISDIEGITLEKELEEGKIIVKGRVTKDQKVALKRILKQYGRFVADYTKDAGEMIQIDAQISELSTSLSKELGFQWSNSLTYTEDMPGFQDGIADLFKIGDFDRTTAITATVSALIAEGKGRVLSKPSIVVKNGDAATFVVGGEVPVVTSTVSSGGSVTQNVSFKSYGVQLSVTPTLKDDKIDITLNVSISDLSENFGTNASYTTTSANTKLMLNDGQTMVLAGLIKHTETDTRRRVPPLGSVPILGLLFRHKSTPTAEQEIVISLTPRLLKEDIKKKEEKPVAEKEAEKKTEEQAKEEETSATEEEKMAKIEEEKQKESSTAEETMNEDEGKEVFDADKEIEKAMEEEGKLQTKAEEATQPVTDAELSMEKEMLTAGEKESPEESLDAQAALDQTNISDAVTKYVQSVQQKISQAISFPVEAKEKEWEGTVKLTLEILSDGTLNGITVKESSGYLLFDKDAANTAQIVSPFDPFPAEIELEELVVTIPVVYSLKENL